MERNVKTPQSDYAARWWHPLVGKKEAVAKIQCNLCPRKCKIQEGQRGVCFVRKNVGGQMVLTTYGRSSGFCIDPIEKKPLNHFYPGSSTLSFGTAGCNLACMFCQNWSISCAKDVEKLMGLASPEGIAEAALAYGAQSVSFTYNDPVIFAEYAIDTALACRERGVKAVAVTAGYINAKPAKEFYAVLDAANVDLKAFSDEFYAKFCAGHLKPVLESLLHIRHETKCWLEITTLLIPNQNDSTEEIKALSTWVAKELGADVPLHFTAFRPAWKINDLPPTPLATLIRARQIALESGLHYVYTGNIHDSEGGATFCPACNAALIERKLHSVYHYDLINNGHCSHCNATIPGLFGIIDKPFGARPVPVRLAR